MENKREPQEVIFYDYTDKCYVIVAQFRKYKQLNCGDCFSVYYDGEWQKVRMEKADSKATDNAWYLTTGKKTIVSGWLIESMRVHYFYKPMEYFIYLDDEGIEHF